MHGDNESNGCDRQKEQGLYLFWGRGKNLPGSLSLHAVAPPLSSKSLISDAFLTEASTRTLSMRVESGDLNEFWASASPVGVLEGRRTITCLITSQWKARRIDQWLRKIDAKALKYKSEYLGLHSVDLDVPKHIDVPKDSIIWHAQNQKRDGQMGLRISYCHINTFNRYLLSNKFCKFDTTKQELKELDYIRARMHVDQKIQIQRFGHTFKVLRFSQIWSHYLHPLVPWLWSKTELCTKDALHLHLSTRPRIVIDWRVCCVDHARLGISYFRLPDHLPEKKASASLWRGSDLRSLYLFAAKVRWCCWKISNRLYQ